MKSLKNLMKWISYEDNDGFNNIEDYQDNFRRNCCTSTSVYLESVYDFA